MVPLSKSGVAQVTVGSTPTLSVPFLRFRFPVLCCPAKERDALPHLEARRS